MKKKTVELNKREKAILKFIEKQVIEDGYPPSVREIGKAVGETTVLCSLGNFQVQNIFPLIHLTST